VDRQLSLFRFGLLVCLVGTLYAATQFDIAESVEAIWNHEPTSEAFAAESIRAENRIAACLAAEKATKPVEYVSTCASNRPPVPEMAGEVAAANIRGFSITASAVLITIFAVWLLGIRMTRESRK
jgi:hypothetical protein